MEGISLLFTSRIIFSVSPITLSETILKYGHPLGQYIRTVVMRSHKKLVLTL